MSTQTQLGATPRSAAREKVVRRTNAQTGRRVLVSPGSSSMRHLSYARIILDSAKPAESFSNGECETGLICLSGEAQITVDGTEARLGKHDAIYIPRDSSIRVAAQGNADLAEFSADVEGRYPLQVVRAAEVAKDPGLEFTTGGPGCKRHLQLLLAKNIEAGRLLVGITQAEPGNWTSWPPHEHAALLEEMYVYFDMPAPAYGLQLVYDDTQNPELVTVVRDGDVVLIPSGYHPNVSVPGHSICFLWAMAAHREVQDRLYGVVNVQPGFDSGLTGLEAGRKK